MHILKIKKYLDNICTSCNNIEYKESPSNIIIKIFESIPNKKIIDDLNEVNGTIHVSINGLMKNYNEYLIFGSGANVEYTRININKKELYEIDDIDYLIYFNKNEFIKNIQSYLSSKSENSTRKTLVFLPIDSEFTNDYLIFYPISSFKSFFEIDSTSKLKVSQHAHEHENLIKEVFDLNELPLDRNPFVYFFQKKLDDKLFADLHSLFYKNILSLLSNKQAADYFIIRGFKSVVIKKDEFNPKNQKILMDLFKFNLDREKHKDKLEITRNIISLYLNDEDTFSNLDRLIKKIFQTVEHHFNAYVQEKINHFFNSRENLIKETINHAKELSAQADKLTTSLNTSLLGLILTGLISSITYIEKQQIFILIVSFIFYISYFILFLILNNSYTKDKINRIEQSFNYFTDETIILSDIEKDDVKVKYLVPSIKDLNKTLRRFKKTILMVLSIYLLLFLFFLLYYLLTSFLTPEQKAEIIIFLNSLFKYEYLFFPANFMLY